jgi:hypothetical protein
LICDSGNHERDYPGSGSFFQNKDSGGECGVPSQTIFHMPTRNKAKSWYLILKSLNRTDIIHWFVVFVK